MIFLTTELFLSGYPPQDLIFRKDFLDKIQLYKKKIIKLTKNKKTIMLINIPEKKTKKSLMFYIYLKMEKLYLKNQINFT